MKRRGGAGLCCYGDVVATEDGNQRKRYTLENPSPQKKAAAKLKTCKPDMEFSCRSFERLLLLCSSISLYHDPVETLIFNQLAALPIIRRQP